MTRGFGSSRLLSVILSGCLAGVLALPETNNPRQERSVVISSFSSPNLDPRHDFSVVSLWREPAPLSNPSVRPARNPAVIDGMPAAVQGESQKDIEDIPLVSRIIRLNGAIRESSLIEAFAEAGADAKLAEMFAEMLAPLIDLDRELANGDRFNMLVEEYYRGGRFVGYGRILRSRYEQAASGESLETVYFEAGERSGYFSPEGKILTIAFLPLPVPAARITSGFSRERQHPILGIVRPHLGIDLAAPKGTPVMAAADGQVSFIGYNGGFGKQIVLKHPGGFRTHYGHLSRYQPELAKGDRVKKQDIIGYVGATGLATGPHLDYRVERNGAFIDPLNEDFLNPPALKETELFRLRMNVEIYDLFLDGRKEQRVLAVKELNPADHSRSL